MSSLADFLQTLFDDGRAAFTGPPADLGPAEAVLARAFADVRLDVAGPPVAFDPDAAVAAAAFIRLACWFLASRDEPAEELERRLVIPDEPSTASRHLSVDLTFRYLPQVYRRARALSHDDPLTRRVEEALRRWPLSGVLSDVAAGPTTPADFDHPGLRLLYAERYARNGRPEWRPVARAAEYYDLVREQEKKF